MKQSTPSRRARVDLRKKEFLKKALIVCGAILGVLFLAFIMTVLIRFGPVATETFFNKSIELKKKDERVNILLLGIGGGKHDGPNLTDTIIFASIDPKLKKITLVSIPRDFWIPDLQAKINTAYAFGEGKEKGGGIKLARTVVSNILDQPVDYVIRIDFNGFIKAVDMLGGLEIDVERTLDDYEYPISGKENDTCGKSDEEVDELATASSQLEAFPCRYEHLHFDKGRQHMDGETALKYVRSRHAVGEEGSDFARSKRQEKVIAAFREKVFSVGTLLNPVKLVSLYDVLQDSIATDIQKKEYDDFIKLTRKMENATIESVILDLGDENTQRFGLLTNPQISDDYKGQWVIIPRLGNGQYDEIQAYVTCKLEGNECDITPTATRRRPSPPTE